MSGLAVAPHAINPNGSNSFLLAGGGFAANASLTIERNEVALGSVTANSSGQFAAYITPAAAVHGAVYTAVNSAGTTMAGQSVEEARTRAPETRTAPAGLWHVL